MPVGEPGRGAARPAANVEEIELALSEAEAGELVTQDGCEHAAPGRMPPVPFLLDRRFRMESPLHSNLPDPRILPVLLR